MKTYVFLLFVVLGLQSCTAPYSTSASQQYLKSRHGAPLVAPPPLGTNNLSTFYVLPTQHKTTVDASIVPPTDD